MGNARRRAGATARTRRCCSSRCCASSASRPIPRSSTRASQHRLAREAPVAVPLRSRDRAGRSTAGARTGSTARSPIRAARSRRSRRRATGCALIVRADDDRAHADRPERERRDARRADLHHHATTRSRRCSTVKTTYTGADADAMRVAARDRVDRGLRAGAHQRAGDRPAEDRGRRAAGQSRTIACATRSWSREKYRIPRAVEGRAAGPGTRASLERAPGRGPTR